MLGNYGLYHSRRWAKKRVQALRRDGYRCRECARFGRTTGAATVHHIHPVEAAPQLALEMWNLLSLCDQCHNRMHDRKTGALTARGLWWRERTPPTSGLSPQRQAGTGRGKYFQ